MATCSEPPRCGLCGKGKEAESICGTLFVQLYNDDRKEKKIAAHKICMQYASGLSQFKKKYKHFGGFAPLEVADEIRRGKRLVCSECGGLEEKKAKKKLSEYERWMKGATAGCAWGKCPYSFHLPCAKEHGILKRFRKAYSKDGFIEIQYKVYCSKDHLKFDLDKMSREGVKEGFNFSNTSTDTEEDSQSLDESASCDVNQTHGCSDANENSRKKEHSSKSGQSPIISDESDFDMQSSQPYPSQTPDASKVDSETSGIRKAKTTKIKGLKSPVIESGSDESSGDEEAAASMVTGRKKKTLKKKKPQKKGTRSPLVPHPPLSQKLDDTPARRDSTSCPVVAQKSSSKKLIRPVNQPTITGFLPEYKHVKKLDFDDENGRHEPDSQDDGTLNKYTTFSMGNEEIYLYNPENKRNNGKAGKIKPSTSDADNRDEAESRGNDGCADANSDSDVEVLEVKLGDAAPDTSQDTNDNGVQANSPRLKRPGSASAEEETKKIKLEPQSIDADSTTEPQPSPVVLGVATVSDGSDGPCTSNALSEDSRVSTPAITRVMGADDFFLCITENRINDAEQGIRLARHVQAATGSSVPLNRIAFWRHAYEESYGDSDIQYRLLFMDDLSKCIINENSDKLHEYIFLKPFKSISQYVGTIQHILEFMNQPGDNNPYDQYLENVRSSVKKLVDSQSSEGWKMQYINDSNRIIFLLHIGDQLDPQSYMRKMLKFSLHGVSDVFTWERNNEIADLGINKPNAIVRYYSTELVKMTQETCQSSSGGYSVYFDSSFIEWWKDVELIVTADWVEKIASGKISVTKRPMEEALKDTEKRSGVHAVKRRIREMRQAEPDSNDSGSQGAKEHALLIVCPVRQNIINIAEYLKAVIPEFCEQNVTGANGTEAVCVADIEGLTLESLVKLVRDLYVALNNFQVTIATGVQPEKGPISCLCLHVSL